MVAQAAETGQNIGHDIKVMEVTPDIVGAAAIHVLYADSVNRSSQGVPLISQDTASTIQDIVVNFRAANPQQSDERYREARTAFDILAQVVDDETQVFALSDEPGFHSNFFTAMAVNPEDRKIAHDVLEASAVQKPDDVPEEEIAEIMQLADSLTGNQNNNLDQEQIAANELPFSEEGGTIVKEKADRKDPKQIAKEIAAKINEAGIGDDGITLTKLRVVLPTAARELQKMGKNEKQRNKGKTIVPRRAIIEALIRIQGRNVDHEAIRATLENFGGGDKNENA